jgi:hypothetical protein
MGTPAIGDKNNSLPITSKLTTIITNIINIVPITLKVWVTKLQIRSIALNINLVTII